MSVVDLGGLGLDRGGHLLIERALRAAPAGDPVEVVGTDPLLAVHLRAYARSRGHRFELGEAGMTLARAADLSRWHGAVPAGRARPDGIVAHPPATWGLAVRGSIVEAGGQPGSFSLADQDVVWTDDAPRLYAQAAAAQWDPATAIDWSAPIDHPDEVEDAVVQVMTYLAENEQAALVVPARFLGRIHPQFREVLQILAVQVADEARHLEVFVRRAGLKREALGLSTVGGRASLDTLLDEPDFALASFLLSVLGEGSFLALLSFLQRYGPDPITREVARLAARDEARHVAFGMAHLERHVSVDPTLLGRLAQAIERRHAALRHTAGLNEEVFDALVLIAAGGWAPEQVATGWDRVQELVADMDRGRKARLRKLGFPEGEAVSLSALHTRNFM